MPHQPPGRVGAQLHPNGISRLYLRNFPPQLRIVFLAFLGTLRHMPDDPPTPPRKWIEVLETPANRPKAPPDVAMSAQSAESLLAIEPPEFTAPMGLTLDMDRVKVTISKHLRNRMRLADRFNRALISGGARKKALEDTSDWRCRARDSDFPAVQAIFDLAFRIEECEAIEDE